MKRETEETLRCAMFVTVIWIFLMVVVVTMKYFGWFAGIGAGVLMHVPVIHALNWLLIGKRWTDG